MNVSDLLDLLKSLDGFIGASGYRKPGPASGLLEVCNGLVPFKDLSIPQFAEFLRQADHYTKTGELPIPSIKQRTTRQRPARQIEVSGDAAQKIQDLYEKALEIDYATIETQLAQLEKKLSKDEVITIARDRLNISLPLKTKKAAMDAIKNRIFGRKDAFHRTNF